MSESLEYIEAFFQRRLNDDENKQFGKRCVDDEHFAKEVARYVLLDEAIRQQVLEQKRQQWRDDEHRKSFKPPPVRNVIFRKWLPYVAAACLIIAIAIYSSYSSARPHQFANKYISEHFTTLPQTMDASKDTLQQGIAAYNN